MSTTAQRIAANRSNALQSTGPTTAEGKAAASRNATRHGVLSTRLFLEDEDPAEFQALLDDLVTALGPVGTMEMILVERIAVTVWRQRRLVAAETASLTLSRQPKRIAATVSSELGRGYGSDFEAKDLVAFDQEREQWCRAVIAEMEALKDFDLDTIRASAPLLLQQLESDAVDETCSLDAFVAGQTRGLTGYIFELKRWCRGQVRQAEERPHALALANDVRAKRLILPDDALQVFSRYQTTLDNQLFKGLRALRDAQEWRVKTIEPTATSTGVEDAATIADAA